MHVIATVVSTSESTLRQRNLKTRLLDKKFCRADVCSQVEFLDTIKPSLALNNYVQPTASSPKMRGGDHTLAAFDFLI